MRLSVGGMTVVCFHAHTVCLTVRLFICIVARIALAVGFILHLLMLMMLLLLLLHFATVTVFVVLHMGGGRIHSVVRSLTVAIKGNVSIQFANNLQLDNCSHFVAASME